MLRNWILRLGFLAATLTAACSGASGDLAVPAGEILNSDTSTVSPQAVLLGEAVPAGARITFVGDVVTLHGTNFQPDMQVWLGMNNDLARRPNSILTTPRHQLPNHAFVYTDPATSVSTKLEVKVPFEYVSDSEVLLTVPPAVSCSPAFTNPILRMWTSSGSSIPVADIYFVTGPRYIATIPHQGLDIGGYDVTIHGDFFSPWTQIAVRYTDPADGQVKVLGTTPATDINEQYVNRNTLVVTNWPGVVPDSDHGLAKELKADILIFENIDEISKNVALEPSLGGVAPCDELKPQGDAPLNDMGTRNIEKIGAFTYLPTGTTAPPEILAVTPDSGSEVGGNTVLIHGRQFDAFTVDLSDPAHPGIGVECPPGSGMFIPALAASLIDRNTIVITMPPCAVDVPQKVDFELRNKFTIDNPVTGQDPPPQDPATVRFNDVYTYIPVPPIEPPVVTAIYPGDNSNQPRGLGHDYGLERFYVVGDWFDDQTVLNGGFEFVLPGDVDVVVQSQRTILHNRNLLEIFTKKLPAPYYPLTADLSATVRVRNTVNHTDVPDAMVFQATPDAGMPPVLDDIYAHEGPLAGGNQIILYGSNFDTTNQVFFGMTQSANVQFISSTRLIATVPAGASAGTVDVTVHDDADVTAPQSYTYDSEGAPAACPVPAFISPDTGSGTGGYTVLLYGTAFTPTTKVEFGVGDGNFSPDVYFVSDNLLRVEVPEALPEQIGATVAVGTTDPLNGCDVSEKTVEFTYTGAQQNPPEILYVDTTVKDPPVPTLLPALRTVGGDQMLVIGKYFDQMTTFDLTKGEDVASVTNLTVLTPNIAVMTSPPSPDGKDGVADLAAHNSFGDSDPFAVQYVAPPPPTILDVRNLNDGTQTAPIDANDRLLIFGHGFFENAMQPLTVNLTGNDVNSPGDQITVSLTAPQITLVEDHLIGVNVPPNTFAEGPLAIQVVTKYGTANYNDTGGDPIFVLLGPQPPIVVGVYPSVVHSKGGDEVVFFGRNFTPTTVFKVRTDLMASLVDVAATRIVSETVAIVTMPALIGAPAPTGTPGLVHAEETDPVLISKINGDPYTESSLVDSPLYRVVNDEVPVLLGVYPDRGLIDGGEQVMLLGSNFLDSLGNSNVTGLRIVDPALGDIGTYTPATLADLPLKPTSKGLFEVINNHQILLITNPRAKITPEDASAAEDVELLAPGGTSTLVGGYTYTNTPAVRTPLLLGITPNETKLSGGTSHLISGSFLTEADRIVLLREGDGATLTIPAADFSEVNDNFLVFTMPDLSSTFSAGDDLTVYAEKDVDGTTLVSNQLRFVLHVSFAGPPTITPTLSPTSGTAFGGTVVEIHGTFFTSNSQVLFGTMPARNVVYVSPTEILAIAPTLPLDVPSPGLDLKNVAGMGGTVDVAVFTQGGWAVLSSGYTFTPQAPDVTSLAPDPVAEGSETRITATGARFLDGDTTVSAALGTVSDVHVTSLGELNFLYQAPTYAAGTLGPKTDTISISTSQGTAPGHSLTIILDPFLTSVSTSYTDSTSSPSTGAASGALVVGTITGGNFPPGGTLSLLTHGGDTIQLTESASLTASGRFTVVSGTQIQFTVPKIFRNDTPTLIDGNPNLGFAAMTFTNPEGVSADLADAFRYIPSVLDFDDYSFSVPTTTEGDASVPNNVTVGDINGDGVPDVVAMARQVDWNETNSFKSPEAYVYIADTFGSVDVNGDGKTPDFAGTFTESVISNDDVRIMSDYNGRGGIVRLADLNGDGVKDLIIPAQGKTGPNYARVLLVQMNSDGSAGTETILEPSSGSGDAVTGIAVGNFDGFDSKPDIAIMIGSDTSTDRNLVFFTSKSTPFDYDDRTTTLSSSLQSTNVYFMESGDFDGDGDDDLAWGYDSNNGKVVVLSVDAAGSTVGTPQALTNLTGGPCTDLDVFDADGDGKVDLVGIMMNHAQGSLVGTTQDGGIFVALDPLNTLTADSYVLTGFVGNTGLNSRTRSLAHADFNGDGITDLVADNSDGAFIIMLGQGDGTFVPTGRSWLLPTLDRTYLYRVHGLAAGDINGDGLGEVFMGDVGTSPPNLHVWNNISR